MRNDHRMVELLSTLERVGPCGARQLHMHLPGVVHVVTLYKHLNRATANGQVKFTVNAGLRVYSVEHNWRAILPKKKNLAKPPTAHHLDSVWNPIKRSEK